MIARSATPPAREAGAFKGRRCHPHGLAAIEIAGAPAAGKSSGAAMKAVEEIAAASMSLAQRAKSVAEAVQVFRTEAGGGSAHGLDAVALRKEMKGQAGRQALSAPA